MNTLRCAACVLLVSVASVSMLSAQQRPVLPAVPLCLTLRLTPKPGGADPSRWGRVHHPPDTVALDTAAALGYRGFRVRPTIGGREARLRGFPFWGMSGDSLEVIWNDGLTGVHLRGRLQAALFVASWEITGPAEWREHAYLGRKGARDAR